jgi:hypothetical protein
MSRIEPIKITRQNCRSTPNTNINHSTHHFFSFLLPAMSMAAKTDFHATTSLISYFDQKTTKNYHGHPFTETTILAPATSGDLICRSYNFFSVAVSCVSAWKSPSDKRPAAFYLRAATEMHTSAKDSHIDGARRNEFMRPATCHAAISPENPISRFVEQTRTNLGCGSVHCTGYAAFSTQGCLGIHACHGSSDVFNGNGCYSYSSSFSSSDYGIL